MAKYSSLNPCPVILILLKLVEFESASARGHPRGLSGPIRTDCGPRANLAESLVAFSGSGRTVASASKAVNFLIGRTGQAGVRGRADRSEGSGQYKRGVAN